MKVSPDFTNAVVRVSDGQGELSKSSDTFKANWTLKYVRKPFCMTSRLYTTMVRIPTMEDLLDLLIKSIALKYVCFSICVKPYATS
jgi:hypothetical protein